MLGLLFAARSDVLSRVLNVVTHALSTAVLKGAGLSRSAGAQAGIVTAIQRFGSALNLNVHLHLLVLDGGYTFADERAQFHRAPACRAQDHDLAHCERCGPWRRGRQRANRCARWLLIECRRRLRNPSA